MVGKNTKDTLGGISAINNFDRCKLDMLAYTYPYHMEEANRMKPHDCQSIFNVRENTDTLEYKIIQLNLRNNLI